MENKAKLTSGLITSIALLGEIACSFFNVTPVLAIIVYATYCLIIFYLNSSFVISYLYLILYFLTNVLGVYIIETRSLMLPELLQISSNVGALSVISAIHILFIETLLLRNDLKEEDYYKITASPAEGNTEFWLQLLVVFQLLVTAVALARIIRYPAVFLGIDRFIYRKQYLSGVWGSVSVLLTLFLPLDFIYFIRYKKKLGILALVGYFLYLFWIGTKFGLYLIAIYWLVVPFARNLNRKQLRKVLAFFAVVFMLLLGMINLQGHLVYNRDHSENAEYLYSRIDQQGQMWWAIYKDFRNQTHATEISDETRTFFTSQKPVDMRFGIYKMMMLETPATTFRNKVYNGNTRYAFSTDASLYYYFGIIGLVVWTIVMAAFYSWVVRRYVSAFRRVRVIQVVLFTKLFLTLNNVLLQSDFDKLFSLQTVVVLVAIVGIDLFEGKSQVYGIRYRGNRV